MNTTTTLQLTSDQLLLIEQALRCHATRDYAAYALVEALVEAGATVAQTDKVQRDGVTIREEEALIDLADRCDALRQQLAGR